MSHDDLLHRDAHAMAVESWLADEAVATGLDVAFVHDIMKAQVEAAEKTSQHNVQLSVG